MQTTTPTTEGWYWVSHWDSDPESGGGLFDVWQMMYFVPGDASQLLGFPPEIHVLNQAMSVSRWRQMPDGSWEDADPIQGQFAGSWCGPKRWMAVEFPHAATLPG